jgi:hypothetical protein
MDLVFERTLKAKETIQGHPLDSKQTIEVFEEKAVGMYGNSTKALKITRGRHRRIWGVWDIPQPWSSLPTHVDRCVQTEDVDCQIMKNNLQRTM